MAVPLGHLIPYGDEHGVSVSMPKWEHMVAWGKKDEQFSLQLQGGYPRFFVPLLVRKLAKELVDRAVTCGTLEHHKSEGSLALVFPHHQMAIDCKDYLQSRSSSHEITVLVASFDAGIQILHNVGCTTTTHAASHDRVLVVVYSEALEKHAKAFWMHTGFGISSRCAAYWLANLSLPGKEERYSLAERSNLPHDEAWAAKIRIRERIAAQASSSLLTIRLEDVTLFHTGMSAIFHSGRLVRNNARASHLPTRIAVFGFLYVDTSKVLERILGFSVIHYGHGSSEDLDKLEAALHESLQIDALYLEFPGNPLLQSPDLHRIWDLSRKFRFLVVVDDTVATMSLDLVPWCDIVCTSLTKMFSGACNVMGGSLVLSPRSEHYTSLRRTLQEGHVDIYFPLDAIVMDTNSIDIQQRMSTACRNAEMLVALLQRHPHVAEVFYPKGSASQHFYDAFKREDARYGYLFSVRFTSPLAAHSFYNALDVAKGPSLGTNFTLCCAYTWLAHASELAWAAEFGVVEDLVRISTGTERWDELDETFGRALDAAYC